MAVKNQKLKRNAKTIPVKRRTRKGVFVAIFAGILVLGAAGTALALCLVNQNSTEQSQDKANDSENHTDMTSGTSSDNVDALASSNAAENKAPAKYEGDNPNNYDVLTGIITFAGVSENKFVVSVAIDQFITGNCRIVASGPSGSEISADVDIMAGPSSSFCSYSGPVPSTPGKYNITVTLAGANKTGIVTGEVEI